MRRGHLVIVSGIWPPDVGGPASHGPAIGEYLAAHEHDVVAFASVSDDPLRPGFPLTTTSRDRPLPVRWADGTAKLLGLTRGAHAVYATGLYHRSAIACRVNRVPLVLKLVNDPAYERARNSGFFPGTLEEFQTAPGNARTAALKRMRDAMVRQAAHVICPSEYLARYVRGWGAARHVTVIPNPAPAVSPLPGQAELRTELGFEGPTAAFAGRFVLQKNLPLLVAAARAVPEVSFKLVGDGPERPALRAEIERLGLAQRITLIDAVQRSEALRWMKAADVTVLPSSWENYPHAVVESLSVGTPVVATSVGGVPEIVEDGVNGLLSPSGDEPALVASLRRALLDSEVHALLRAGAAATGDRYAPERVFGRAADVIAGAVAA